MRTYLQCNQYYNSSYIEHLTPIPYIHVTSGSLNDLTVMQTRRELPNVEDGLAYRDASIYLDIFVFKCFYN